MSGKLKRAIRSNMNQIALFFSDNYITTLSATDSASGIIPTRSLNRNLNQFELSFITRGISIISVVCQIWSI